MNKNITVGILERDQYDKKEAFLDAMSNKGFYICSIYSKVKEMAKFLLKKKEEDVTDEEICIIRKKGYSVNKLYWTNLLLTSLPEDKNLIVIYDLWDDDLQEGYVMSLISDPIILPNVDPIILPKNTSEYEINEVIKNIEIKAGNIV